MKRKYDYLILGAGLNQIYFKYKILTNDENNVIFERRLAEYKYYNMHNVIDSALKLTKSI